MSSFYNYISLAEHLIPIFISFYLGSWSDHYGRKPFIYISMTGFLFSSVMNLMNVIYLKEWDKWVWLASVILSKNVFGGGLGFVMVVYSFIADNSTDKYVVGLYICNTIHNLQATDNKTSDTKFYLACYSASRRSDWCLAFGFWRLCLCIFSIIGCHGIIIFIHAT